MDVNKYKSTMNSLNYGNVMAAAARDYQKEMMAKEAAANARQKEALVSMDDLENDPDLEQIHRDRLLLMKKEQEKRQEMSRKGHGTVTEIQEQDFLPEVTGSEMVLVHFYHNEFERCRILDKHLALLAPKYFETKFLRVHAPDAPFFVHKLQIQVLPCLVFFRNGICFDRVVGFDELNGKDDFKTATLEMRLKAAGILKKKTKTEDDSEDEKEDAPRTNVRKGGFANGFDRPRQLDSDDETSDFSDEE